MKNNRYTIAALALCVLSFGASAATPVPPSGHQDHTQVGIAKASDVEAFEYCARRPYHRKIHERRL